MLDDTEVGLCYDEEAGLDLLTFRTPNSNGVEEVIDVGGLEAIEEKLYDIVRCYKSGYKKIMDSSLTLDEAKEHCQGPDSKGDGYCDGFAEEGEYTTDLPEDEQE